MLIDSHCHLDWKSFKDEIVKVIERAKKNDLIAAVTSTIGEEITETLKIVERFPNFVYYTLGLHPPKATDQAFNITRKLILKHQKEIRAIGEVGLDYYWIKDERQRRKQQEIFIKFIKFANELEKPLVIHVRKADDDALKILEQTVNESQKVLLHCFSGNSEHLQRALENKFLISVPTSVVNRKVHKNSAKRTPLDFMVLETDAPFLSPIPNENRNEPANIKISCQKVAEIKSVSFKEVAEKTTRNAINFFDLDL
ncbi:MAG: TatD family deoxyribonuclease [Candidatus Lokiarchaeota archaeon]|nr:TatD family deoxyribonuclease [Candidatus Lokiarchaeota archaeon]